jgi:hypothetical protein
VTKQGGYITEYHKTVKELLVADVQVLLEIHNLQYHFSQKVDRNGNGALTLVFPRLFQS